MKLSVARLGLFLLPLIDQATSLVTNLPTLNGPVPPVMPRGGKTGLGQFKHPGLWHSHDDLELMRTKVSEKQEPWISGFNALQADSYSSVDYRMQGPKEVLSRGRPSNYTSFTADTRAAYRHAILWYITRDDAHFKVATSIIDAWGTSLTNIIGIDTSLLVGIEGDILSSEAGRDQSHVHVLLKASEYTAKYNLNETVEYDPQFSRCLAVLVDGPWDAISEQKRGISPDLPGVWDLIYYKYAVQRGKRAPWTAKAKEFYDAQGGQKSGGYTVMGWGDLIWAKEGRKKRFWERDSWRMYPSSHAA
ncbi:Histone deacetylase clr3 [Verticillium dahliae VDG1]|nr:Histone deacetylase clr3 [Verticillium dahliae VDG1]